jgi:hypothetical protein
LGKAGDRLDVKAGRQTVGERDSTLSADELCDDPPGARELPSFLNNKWPLANLRCFSTKKSVEMQRRLTGLAGLL